MNKEQAMETVWRERARRLSQSPKLAGAGQSTLPVVVVGIGKEHYGIPIEDVAEVFPPLRPTPVPGAPALFSGVINVHGEIRPPAGLSRMRAMRYRSNVPQGRCCSNPWRAIWVRARWGRC